MAVGRRRPDPEQGHGSGISIGGNNIAPLQNVVGQNISNVHQSASVQGATVDVETVRDLLAAFRTEVDRNGAVLPNTQVLRAMADSIDTSLTAPDAQAVGALRGAVQALPALVAGTAVQQGGEALAHAIAGWLG
ncbi:hypothetical protein [Streptomyces aurantiacus]|uniref:hypothetical protein n=1 Tax=Streptomyces aurantiacus TaxID=47760 RepID=UPI0006E3A336|nr:hypothetical protein [Streptomyces aurantiacus]